VIRNGKEVDEISGKLDSYSHSKEKKEAVPKLARPYLFMSQD